MIEMIEHGMIVSITNYDQDILLRRESSDGHDHTRSKKLWCARARFYARAHHNPTIEPDRAHHYVRAPSNRKINRSESVFQP